MLNCKLGCLPMKYLGIPLSDNRLGSLAFAGLKEKMGRRLDPWKGKHLSSGGKLVLTNACLTSLPIFTMGFYLLPKSSHGGMDSVRGKFFWQGAREEFKYHMAKWDTLSRPKDQGGLGIINTQIMNECLLVKWIWKITKGSNDTWYKLLEVKYMSDGNFFSSKCKGTSQFWQGLHKVKHLFKWGAMHKVGDGSLTFFWGDTWLGQLPLKTLFPELFRLCEDPTVLVSDCFANSDWCVNFWRSLTPRENVIWKELFSLLQNVVLVQDS